MVQINFAQKSVTVKIVYYGPGMSGKTTNLEVVHQRAPESNKGDLTSISTDGDRTLFFDFMPLDLGTVAGMRTQFQLYTVPGQVYYNSTRKLVLQGVDGVIFIADSSASMMEENLESLRNLEENLREYGKDIKTIPMVIQYNKRDLPDALPVEELEAKINSFGAPSFEGIASSGQGVFPTLKALAANVLDTIHEQSGRWRGALGPRARCACDGTPLGAASRSRDAAARSAAGARHGSRRAAERGAGHARAEHAHAGRGRAADGPAPAPVTPSPELRLAQPTAPPSMPSSPPASAIPMAPMPPPTAVHTPPPRPLAGPQRGRTLQRLPVSPDRAPGCPVPVLAALRPPVDCGRGAALLARSRLRLSRRPGSLRS